MSHGGREVRDPLIALMASQVRLTKKQFKDLVDCPMSAEQYIQELQKLGINFQ